MLEIHKVLRGYLALSHADGGVLYLSRRNHLYRYTFATETLDRVVSLPTNAKFLASACSRYLRRLLRADIRYGTLLDDESMLLVSGGRFFVVDLVRRTITEGPSVPRGSRPLNVLSLARSCGGVEPGVYFGEYFSNPEMAEVHIFKLSGATLEPVFTFPRGKINHVHNIIADPDNDAIWVLTGDFDGGAAIYRTNSGFRGLTRVLHGEQRYRSCVAFPHPRGLVYATDSQFTQNFVNLLTSESGAWCVSPLTELNGPCIFGARHGTGFLFSTSVEAVNSGSRLRRMVRTTPGPGIKTPYSELVFCDRELSFEVLARHRKDPLPFVSFQFGNILLPGGSPPSDFVVYSNLALAEHDMSTVLARQRFAPHS